MQPPNQPTIKEPTNINTTPTSGPKMPKLLERPRRLLQPVRRLRFQRLPLLGHHLRPRRRRPKLDGAQTPMPVSRGGEGVWTPVSRAGRGNNAAID